MKVKTPTGETYRIHRRWLPWRRRTRSEGLDWMPDIGDAVDLGDDPFSLAIVAVLLIPFLLVLAFFVGEFLLLLLLLPFFVLARSVFGTPWVIEVTRQREVVQVEAVKGWGESRRLVERLATALRQGHAPQGGIDLAKAQDQPR